MLMDADAVLCFERDHLGYIGRVHPEYADRAVLIRDAAARLEPPGTLPLRDRISALAALEPGADVIDPAGHDVDVFIDVAREIVGLLDEVLPRLAPPPR